MKKKIEILICLGSSCFSRGNKQEVQIIQEMIKDNNLEEYIYFIGHRCFGNCARGPIIKVNDRIYEQVQARDIIDIFKDILKLIDEDDTPSKSTE